MHAGGWVPVATFCRGNIRHKHWLPGCNSPLRAVLPARDLHLQALLLSLLDIHDLQRAPLHGWWRVGIGGHAAAAAAPEHLAAKVRKGARSSRGLLRMWTPLRRLCAALRSPPHLQFRNSFLVAPHSAWPTPVSDLQGRSSETRCASCSGPGCPCCRSLPDSSTPCTH